MKARMALVAAFVGLSAFAVPAAADARGMVDGHRPKSGSAVTAQPGMVDGHKATLGSVASWDGMVDGH